MEWVKEPISRYLARSLRKTTQGQELKGHRFFFNDLKELYSAGHFALARHGNDRIWQLFRAPDGGNWELHSIHRSRTKAEEAAIEEIKVAESGTYLLARFDKARPWMRVRITSLVGMKVIGDIFRSLDCEVSQEVA